MEAWEKPAGPGDHVLPQGTSFLWKPNISPRGEASTPSRPAATCFLCLSLTSGQLFPSHSGYVQRRFWNQASCWGEGGRDVRVGASTGGDTDGRGHHRHWGMGAVWGEDMAFSGSFVKRPRAPMWHR